ncbi:MAG TPA: ABC transporter ATP-binding protein [bacterium]|nr:ABC transporter ATP-binding protein [bacterium]HPN43033.1 ABC transporter ATP-binding protein [bacterium]
MLSERLYPLRFISKYLLHYKWQLTLGLVYIIIMTGLQVLTPWLLRYAIDYMQSIHQTPGVVMPDFTRLLIGAFQLTTPLSIIFSFSLLIVIATIIQGIFRFLMRDTLIGVSRKMEYELRNDYYAHLQTLTPSFFQRNQTGDLMARATNDLNAVRTMVGPGIMYFISTFFLFIIVIVFMIKINANLTFWALLTVPPSVLVIYKLVSKIEKLFDLIQSQFSALTSTVEENVSGIRVIKSYNRQEHVLHKFNKVSSELITRNMALARVQSTFRSFIQFITGTGTLIILWVGGHKIIAGTLSIGGLVAFFSYLIMLTWPMIAAGWVLNMWQQGIASLKRLISIMGEKPEFADDARTDPAITRINGEIEFRDICFSYHADEPEILSHVNLKIKAGSTVAIVGPTGSGKSTLVNLVPRLFEPHDGQLFIDGHDIRTIPLQTLRKAVGYVPQESYLFSDTLLENIVFGLESYQPQDVVAAMETSQIIRDMDQFPEKLETIVGERGITLSGGQKQRTAISRAVIKKPAILILDDSLSAVDTYTEEEILKQLRRVMDDCTAIIVSHRISSIRDADEIIVLNEGRIVEQGRHSALLKNKGLYYNLFQRQRLEESLQEMQ